jgi:type III pantothenate kinase
MDLVLDLGNTNKKIALLEVHPACRVPVTIKLLESHPSVSLPMIRRFVREHPGIRACILSSVINHPVSVTSFLKSQFAFIELGAGTPLPLKNRYHTPETLGKDRLAAAVYGASAFPGKEVLVINAGTCITYDFVNARGEYIGGSISPGLQLRFRSLHTFTGKLPLVSFKKVSNPIGKDTESAILSGVICGMIHEIEGVAGFYLGKYPEVKIILSGGDVNYFVKQLKISIFAVPNCVIYGLHQILRFNVKSE